MPRFTRLHQRTLLLTAALLLLLALFGGTLYYFVHFRFAQSLAFLIERESKGRYVFEAGEAKISFWNRTVTLKAARLHCRDTVKGKAALDIRLPELYFSMGSSWRSLLFHHQLMVDSMAVIQPEIDVRLLHRQAEDPGATPAADILGPLDSTLRRLHVRSFSLQDAAFSLTGPGGHSLHGDHIDIRVADFNQGGGGEVSVTLGHQHWVKPVSGLTLDLARLAFDSRTQRFEVDSLAFTDHHDSTRMPFSLATDRLYFTSHQLKDVIREGRLFLDSLICINPVVNLPAGANTRTAGNSDTAAARRHAPFFRSIHVNFTQVLNGLLQTRDAAGSSAAASTRKANLRIFGLQINATTGSAIMADSIAVLLHHLQFLSKDSAHRLTIEDLTLVGNDAVFQQVRLEPTHPEPNRTVLFTAPRLLIKNISIPDLLRSRLRAAGAELVQPLINLTDNAPRKPQQGKMELFYKTLHGVSQIIDAPYLDIIDGSHHFVLGGPTPVEFSATGLQAHILLNKLFLSGNLLDIKQALTHWNVAVFKLITPKARLSAVDYRLNGNRRSSTCRQAQLLLSSGWQLDATDIFWDALSWDQLQRNGLFHIDSLYITSLAVHRTPGDSIQCTTSRLRLTGLSATATGGIRWDQAKAKLRNLSILRPRLTLHVTDGDWNSDKGLVLHSTTVTTTTVTAITVPATTVTAITVPATTRSTLDFRLPLITLDAPIHSIDKNGLPPLALSIPKARLSFAATGSTDTLHFTASLNLKANDIRLKSTIAASLDINWEDASGERRSKDAVLSATGLAGSFHDANADTALLHNADWRTWLTKATLKKGHLQYRTKKLAADIANCSWTPTTRTLDLAGFSVSPILSRDACLKQAAWQNDYVTVHGRRLTFTGIRLGGEPRHPSLEVPAMTVDGVQVEASRDKHIPFHHGIERAMPTRLLATIHADLKIDTIHVLGCKVIYNEWPVTSSRWTTITVDELNGEIRNLHTRPETPNSHTAPGDPRPQTPTGDPDSLHISASARIFDGQIRRFLYNESYTDSLSGFTARCTQSAFDLTKLSSVLVPAAAVNVVRGHLDTIWSVWQGNRYAAYGKMGFYYDRLKVMVLNKKDSARRDFLPVVETWATNLILPGRNKRESPIFFERDREKFIFNYWVKCQGSGVISALIHSKGRGYAKQYAQDWQRFRLPPPGAEERRSSTP